MFDLMGAIRKRQQAQMPPPADSAETAESPELRAEELAEDSRKTADNSRVGNFSAIIRKSPHTPKASETPKTRHLQRFSADPQNPHPPRGKERLNPETVLVEIAKTLRADAHMLRALMSDDDMQAIAENCPGYDRKLLTDYFRKMEENGKELVDLQWHLDHLLQTGHENAHKKSQRAREWETAWRAAHEHFMNHLATCSDCYAPRARYCAIGAGFRQTYLEAYQDEHQSEE